MSSIKLIKEIKYKIRYFIFNNLILNIFSKTPFLSSFYYFILNTNFYCENFSVLNGIRTALNNPSYSLANSAILNRNIHRLEKGLSLPEKKEVFALDYILETVAAYRIEVNNNKDSGQLKWAFDVLTEYFSLVKHVDKVNQAYSQFSEINYMPDNSELKFLPYNLSDVENSRITVNDFIKLSQQRKSVRKFTNKPISEELIKKAFEIALMSPCSCNRQPFRLEVITDIETIRINNSMPAGITGFVGDIPAICYLIGDLSAYQNEGNRHLVYVDGGIMSMNFMYALNLLDLASCPLNWPDISDKEKELKRILNLKDYEKCVICFAIGHPDPTAKVLYSKRRDISTVWRFNNVNTT